MMVALLWRQTHDGTLYFRVGFSPVVEGEEFRVCRDTPSDRQLIRAIPVDAVDFIVLFGDCSLASETIYFALEQEIPVLFLSRQGN